MKTLVARALGAAVLALAGIVACGDRTSLDTSPLGSDDGGSTLPPGCGDGKCDPSSETCASCSVDCGVCAGCGDKKCDGSETCDNCPEDCGSCAKCGDGRCNGNETCENCAPDCGVCPGCGDGKCTPPKEDCFSCPEDCGKCPDCGNGLCTPPKTCASCEHDCGPCAVCGNGKCEPPYETCTNCHEDCGDCQTIGCLEMLTCSFKCVDQSTKPPTVSITCVANCISLGCASAQFFFNQAFQCFIQNVPKCGGFNLACLQKQCDAEVAACIASKC